jgi:hypothetical protein
MVHLAGLLIALGALVALSGGPSRLPRSWSWLPCVIPAAGAAGVRGSFRMENDLYEGALLLLAVIVICWLVTDARPVFGFCVALLLTGLSVILATTGSLDSDISALMASLVLLAIVAPIMLSAAWLLRRKSVPSPRPIPKP